MMRKLFVALGVLTVILAVLVVLAVLNLNYFINRNKDYLLAQVEESLGREVTVGKVETGFTDGIGIRLSDFSVSDDREFSDGNFLRAKNIQVNVSFFPLLGKKIIVTKLILNKPEITVIRNKNGDYNFSTLSGTGKSEKSGDETNGNEDGNKVWGIPIAASNIEIKDGSIKYIDEGNGRELTARKIDLSVKDLGFEKEIVIKLRAAVLAQDQNVMLDATLGPISPGADYGSAALSGDARLSVLDVSTLKKSLPALKEKLPQGLDISGPVRAKFRFSGRADALTLSDIDVDASVFGASKPNLKLTGSVGPLGDGGGDFSIDTEFKLTNADLNKLRKLSFFKNSIPNSLSSHGNINISGKVSGKPGDLKLKGVLIDATATRLAVIGKFLKSKGTPLVIKTGADIRKNKIKLSETEIKLSSLILTLSGHINQGTTTLLNLSLNSNNINMSDMQEIFPQLKKYGVSGQLRLLPTRVTGEAGKGQTPRVTGALDVINVSVSAPQLKRPVRDINTRIDFTGDSARLEELTLRIGDSQLRLGASISDFSPLTLSYNLSSPELNLSDLKKGASKSNRPDVLKDLKSEGKLTMNKNALSFRGSVSSSEAVLSGLELTDLKSSLNYTGQMLKVQSFSMRAYGGTISGRASYNTGPSPEFALIASVRSLDIGELLASRNPGGEERITGRANLDINIFGSGSHWERIKRNLKGTAKAEIIDGAVLDINLAEEVLKGITGVPGLTVFISERVRERYPQVFSARDTEFQELKASFILEKGKMRTNDLRIVSTDYRITGRGWISLESRVDMKSLLTLSRKLSEDLEEDVPELKYILSDKGLLEIPFVITGTLPNAKPEPDTGYLATLIQRATIRKGTEELKKQVLDKLLAETQEESQEAAEGTEATETAPQNKGDRKGGKYKKKKRLDERILDELRDLF